MKTNLITSLVSTGILPNPTPDWDFLGINAALSIYNGIWGLVIVAGGIGVLVGAAFLIFGKVSQSQRAHVTGLVVCCCSIAGIAIGAGAGGLINFGANLTL